MSARSQVLYTTGVSGSGKTLRRGPWYVTKELLPQTDLIHISTFPWKFEPWTDGAGIERQGLLAYMAERGMDEETVRHRVRVIPEEVTHAWRNDEWKEGNPICGPWDYFADEDLSGVHLAIDEVHNYCPKAGAGCRRIQQRWSRWLGELRHRGATIEFLSQNPAKVASCIENEAEIRLELVNSSHRPDPFLGVKMHYWYQLQAKLTGLYRPSCWQQELRQVNGKWVVQEEKPFWFDDELFGLYDTWSAPVAGGKKGTTGKQPYQIYSLPRLLAWFWLANAWPLSWRPAVVAAVVAAYMWRSEIGDAYFGFFAQAVGGKKSEAAAVESEPVRPAIIAQPAAPAAVDADKLAALEARITKALDERDELAGELAARTAELSAIKARVDEAFAVASITPGQVTFRGGYSYGLGDTIDWGPYEGAMVRAIDWQRRSVHLADGRTLRMGVDGSGDAGGWLQKLDTASGGLGKAAASVRGALSGPGERTAAADGRAATEPARHLER